MKNKVLSFDDVEEIVHEVNKNNYSDLKILKLSVEDMYQQEYYADQDMDAVDILIRLTFEGVFDDLDFMTKFGFISRVGKVAKEKGEERNIYIDFRPSDTDI
ncbi:hypothetical protein [Thioalkalivibrio sp. HK1]|uniref:hypothetical protein n=1 Tax=Thioalkalivibrio sp. HK1 TaxID=1469245 RepID=UPI0012DF7212|nr:hypothetical protein [Thioalkalivibrio sp. HK1]